MSKFDNLFNKPTPATNNNGSFGRPNSFITKSDTKVKTNVNYDYKEEAFPDLLLSNKPTTNASAATTASASATLTKKYSDIAATLNEVQKVEKNPVPPGWTQYTKSKGNWKFDVAHGDKTKRELEMDQEEELLNNPAYIYNQMIETLSNNWSQYKTQYDSIHGEGAYDLIYYSEPVYPEDEYLSDGISNYNNDYTGSYEYVNKYSYEAETESE
jgi:hypothetical protein